MKHAGCVYAENTVIALITILLISNFYSLSGRLPARAFVENSFHPFLLRNMFCMSNGSSDPYHSSLQKSTRCLRVCLHDESYHILVLSKLPVIFCIFVATAQLNFQKPAGRLFFSCLICSQTDSLMLLLYCTSVLSLIRSYQSQRIPVSIARANYYISRAHI